MQSQYRALHYSASRCKNSSRNTEDILQNKVARFYGILFFNRYFGRLYSWFANDNRNNNLVDNNQRINDTFS